MIKLDYFKDQAELFYSLGEMARKQNNFEEAISFYEKALSFHPDHFFSLFCLATLSAVLKRHDRAMDALHRVLSLQPDFEPALYNLGMLAFHCKKREKAIEIFKMLEKTHPENPQHRYCLSVVYLEMGRNEEAFSLLQENLKMHPEHWNSRFSIGILHLLWGNYSEGFKEFECRLKEERDTLPFPRWGGEAIEGKVLLVRSDGGIGDTVQFMRYVPLLSFYRCEVIVELYQDLHPHFSHLGVRFATDKSSVDCDFQVGINSLPFLFKTTLSTIPPPVQIDRVKLAPVSHRIGIVWKGSPVYPSDANRSISLKKWLPILQLKQIELISLQKEVTPEEEQLLDAYRVKRPVLNNWSDTLTYLGTCERVITVDTAMAHFAGSLGIPTSILIAFGPDWRWLLKRKDSPWYPSVSLYRQKKLDSWDEVIEEVVSSIS